MRDGLHIDNKNIKTYDAMRVGKIMRKYGFEKFVKRENGMLMKAWRKKVG